MTTKAKSNRALEHLGDTLRAHDWMSTTRALDVLAQILSENAQQLNFHEVSRVSHLLEKQAMEYILSVDCTAELGRTLAGCIRLKGPEVLKVRQPAALQALVHRFPLTTSITERVELYHGLLDIGQVNLCRHLILPQEVDHLLEAGTAEHPWEVNMLVGMVFSSLVECFRKNENPEQHWLDLINHLGNDLHEHIRGCGHGADAPLALRAFGFKDIAQIACVEALSSPKIGDVGHYEKLASCGHRLKGTEKQQMLATYKSVLSHKDTDEHTKEVITTKLSSIMALDFDEHGDYAFSSAITLLPKSIFDKALADASNYLWEHRDAQSKARLVGLLDETYDSPKRVKAVRSMMDADLYKQLRLGREQVFAADLGL